MEQLWQDFISWLSTTGLDTIVSWVLSGGLGTFALILYNKLKSSKTQEIIASKTSEIITKQFDLAVNELQKSFNESLDVAKQNNENYEEINKTINVLKSALLLLIANSNVNDHTRDLALQLLTAKDAKPIVEKATEQVCEEIENVVVELAKKSVEQETKENDELQKLIEEVGA